MSFFYSRDHANYINITFYQNLLDFIESYLKIRITLNWTVFVFICLLTIFFKLTSPSL